MAKVKKASPDRIHFWCPGCDEVHGVRYAFPAPYGPDWAWNGDFNKPTITPSIAVSGFPDNKYCHSFVSDGQIQFLSDSTHALAGLTVELPDWPYE